MRDVFVTGGSGFVGRNLLRSLVARGDRVRALSRAERSDAEIRATGAQPVRGDLTDEGVVRTAMQGADTVFHAAAKVEEWGLRKDFEEVTIRGTERVLHAARDVGVQTLVHVSTEAVLLDGNPLHNVDETRPIPRKPLGLYAWSKARAEEAVRSAASDSLRTVVVRPRLIWGAGDTVLLPKIIEAVRSGRFAWIAGGRFPTSTTHVQNVVAGLLAAEARGRNGEVYFVTDGEPQEFRSFVSAQLRQHGVALPDREIPFWLAHSVARVTDALWTLAGARKPPPLTHATVHLLGEQVTVSDSKARTELGYRNAISVAEGLASLTTQEKSGSAATQLVQH